MAWRGVGMQQVRTDAPASTPVPCGAVASHCVAQPAALRERPCAGRCRARAHILHGPRGLSKQPHSRSLLLCLVLHGGRQARVQEARGGQRARHVVVAHELLHAGHLQAGAPQPATPSGTSSSALMQRLAGSVQQACTRRGAVEVEARAVPALRWVIAHVLAQVMPCTRSAEQQRHSTGPLDRSRMADHAQYSCAGGNSGLHMYRATHAVLQGSP